MECSKFVRLGTKQHAPVPAAHQTRRKIGRFCHLVAQRKIGQQEAKPAVGFAGQIITDAIFGPGEAGGLGIGCDIRQRVNGRPARQRVGRTVHMDRNQQSSANLAGDRGALLKTERRIAVAGQRDPDPPVLRQQVA